MGAATTAGTHRLALLSAASAAVALAAADTYVVVLALTDMMAGVGIGIDSLQRATPIISGFLLGYIAVLPLIGRLSDLLDRRRILLGCLLVFAVGSAVTALAVEMPVLVTGRVLQGVGGGGLVPATLALVADLWPPHRRGTPLGVVGAVQELGSVLGPVLGAIVLAWSGWRAIFWLNVAAALVLYAVIHLLGSRSVSSGAGSASASGSEPGSGRSGERRGSARRVGTGPCRWRRQCSRRSGSASRARAGGAGVARHRRRARRAVRALRRHVAAADADRGRRARAAARRRGPDGTALVGRAAARRPRRGAARRRRARQPRADLRVVRPGEGGRRSRSATASCPSAPSPSSSCAWWHRRAADPLIPRGVVGARGLRALVVSLLVGAALVAVVVDVPLLARLTDTYDETGAALVLVRFLLAVPVGALLGGWSLRRLGDGAVAGTGLLLAGGRPARHVPLDPGLRQRHRPGHRRARRRRPRHGPRARPRQQRRPRRLAGRRARSRELPRGRGPDGRDGRGSRAAHLDRAGPLLRGRAPSARTSSTPAPSSGPVSCRCRRSSSAGRSPPCSARWRRSPWGSAAA